jgi:hydroxyethylthiazole kinase-like sugar kinase family protein
MSAVAIAVNISGTADTEDKQALVLIIDRENERRVFTTLPPLPKSTAAERRTSAETILSSKTQAEFQQLVAEAADKANQDNTFRSVKTKWNELTPQQRTAWLNFNP